MTEEHPEPRDPKLRLENLRYGDDLLDSQIDQRNERKERQEGQARAVIVAATALMTIELAIGKDAGVLVKGGPAVARAFLGGSLLAGVIAVIAAVGVTWLRKYDRFGEKALKRFNDTEFLDSPTHSVIGQTVASKIGIATKLDDRHEEKAKWLKGAFVALIVSLGCLVGQGVVLGIDPPAKASPAKTILVLPQKK